MNTTMSMGTSMENRLAIMRVGRYHMKRTMSMGKCMEKRLTIMRVGR